MSRDEREPVVSAGGIAFIVVLLAVLYLVAVTHGIPGVIDGR